MSKIEWTKSPFCFVGLDEFGNPVFVTDKKTVTSGQATKKNNSKHLKTKKNGKF